MLETADIKTIRQSATKQKSIYFPNLNGLRAIAAFVVIVHHFTLSRGYTVTGFFGRIATDIGKIGVMLFFSLSGFLITYLLLAEKENTGEIGVKQFYMRRILRIWPLYFLIVIGALLVFNKIPIIRVPGVSYLTYGDDFRMTVILYLAMLPNIAHSLQLKLPFADQTWSIGVEEQFYLLWPLVIGYATRYMKSISIIILAFLILRTGMHIYTDAFHKTLPSFAVVFIRLSCFDVMAIGAAGAVLLYYNTAALKFLFGVKLQLIVYMFLGVSIVLGFKYGPFTYQVYGLLFTFLILNAAGNDYFVFNLEQSLLVQLGKISYGLYMFHFLGIRFSEIIAYRFTWLANEGIRFVITCIITTVLSIISYHFFESYFIKKKKRYTLISSGSQ